MWVRGVCCPRIDPLHFLAGCRRRWLNQSLVVALGFFSLLDRACFCVIFSVYGCMLCLVCYLFVISTSVIDCLGRFVPEMTYYVSRGTLTLLNSTQYSKSVCVHSTYSTNQKIFLYKVLNIRGNISSFLCRKVCFLLSTFAIQVLYAATMLVSHFRPHAIHPTVAVGDSCIHSTYIRCVSQNVPLWHSIVYMHMFILPIVFGSVFELLLIFFRWRFVGYFCFQLISKCTCEFYSSNV